MTLICDSVLFVESEDRAVTPEEETESAEAAAKLSSVGHLVSFPLYNRLSL